MTDVPRDGLLGYWPGTVSPGGRLSDRSPEGNHGSFGPTAKWIWFTNPRAARYVGAHDRTYVGYLGGATGRDIVVGTCDHDTGTFSETTLATDVSTDDHVGPAVFPREDGHLLAFWSKHDGPGLSYRLTEEPEEPETFGRTRRLDGEAVCYPSPVQPGEDGPLYLFYRDRAGTGDGHPYYRVSTDGGRSFSEPTRLLTAPEGHYSVYWVAAADEDGIHLFFTDAEGPSTGPKWNVGYARFDDGRLSTADGEVIAAERDLPIRVEDLEILYDASDENKTDPWIWDCGVDADGNPAVVYATFPSTQSHVYRYTRRVDGEWLDRKLVDAGRYLGADPLTGYFSAGIAMPTNDPDVVFAAVTQGERTVLKRFETTDDGRTFTSETVSTRAVADNFRPVVPENYVEECPVVWLSGAYNHLGGCQSVLRGVPGATATGGPLVGDGHRGASLGIDLYGSAAFRRGLTVAAAFETDSPSSRQGVVDFGRGIQLWVSDDEVDSASLVLNSPETSVRLTCDGVTAGHRHLAVGTWDGETASFGLDGDRTTAEFEGPLALDGDRQGWTVGKPGHFDGPGVQGKIDWVALYNRPLAADERNRLASESDSV